MPKLLYILRTSPCFDNTLLASFDDAIRRGLSLVLNLELTDTQWSQATLPVQMESLGLRSACMLASSAFLASAAATIPLKDAILSGSTKGAEDPAVSSATKIWTAQAQSATQVEAMRYIQKAWNTPMAVKVFEKILTDDSNTQTDTARLREAATPNAGDWLHAPPLTAVELRLSDEAIRIAVGFRLGSRTCQPHSCVCGAMVDAKGLHGLSCKISASRQIRHTQMNYIIWSSEVRQEIEVSGCQ